jgi:hypothetical protein
VGAVVTLPLRTVSEANSRAHWAERARRAKRQRGVAHLALVGRLRDPWVVAALDAGFLRVRLVRIAPRDLDTDNLASSLKAIRDGVTDALGLASDRDPRVAWVVDQERGRPRQYAVRVEVTA